MDPTDRDGSANDPSRPNSDLSNQFLSATQLEGSRRTCCPIPEDQSLEISSPEENCPLDQGDRSGDTEAAGHRVSHTLVFSADLCHFLGAAGPAMSTRASIHPFARPSVPFVHTRVHPFARPSIRQICPRVHPSVRCVHHTRSQSSGHTF